MSDVQPIAVVPARLASERLPRKPLVDLGGAPLIQRVCENLQRAGAFARIVVAADAAEVASVATAAGFEAVLTDPALPSGTDRVAAAARALGLAPDRIVVNVQGDEPFVAAAALRALSGAIAPGDAHIVTPVEPIEQRSLLGDPNVVKVALGAGRRGVYFSRSPIPFARDGGGVVPGLHLRHVGVYAYSVATLMRLAGLREHPLERAERLEQLRWLAHGEHVVCVPIEPSARGIDTEEDRLRADAHYRQSLPGPR